MNFNVSEKTFYDLEWDRIVDVVAGFAATLKGRAACMSLPFYDDREELKQQLLLVQQYRELLVTEDAPGFGGIFNVADQIAKARKEVILDLSEIMEVASTSQAVVRISKTLAEQRKRVPQLSELASGLEPMSHSTQVIKHAVDLEKGELRDNASSVLGELRRKTRNLHEKIKKKLDYFLNAPEMQSILRDNYFTLREERYVLPVRAHERAQVKGIVHGSSGSGQTVFIEPRELVAINNDLKVAQLELEREIKRILKSLTAAVAEDGDAILRNLEILKELDVVSAKAHSAEMLNCNKPVIVDEPLLDLKKARHPLLAIKGIEVMPNDLQIGENFSVLVVSGVNAGGKTVALKTMGLCFLMAMAGLHTPCAEGSRIGRFSELVTVMGDEQSLSDGLSTFSANIQSLNRMLDTCRPDSLLLLDEIIIGTDPQQGATLAQAVMEKIAKKQARCAVATHYDSLKRLAFSREEFSNAAVGFSEEKLKPTYSLTIGMPGSSSAFNMARELGLADDVVDRAVELDSGGSEIETMVMALEREVERQHEIQAALERKLADIERQKLEYARKLELLKSREWELEDRHQQELLEEVRKAKEEVRGVVRELQKDGSMRDANEALKKLRDQEDELARRQSRSRQLKREEEQSRKPGARKQPKLPVTKPEDIKTGMWVHISNLDRNGVIVEPPEGNKAALVEVGRLKMRIPTERMHILPASQKPQSKTGKITMSDSFSSVGGDSGKPLTCDLRGEMVDEALSMVDSFLDRALRANAPFVYFIHGHGTGRLKHALRDYLRSVSYVKSFRPGERGEGQDGVTVVVLEDA